jgi:hypothetical protein
MADLAVAVRTYLLTIPAITDIVGQRIYTDILPQSAALPAVTMDKVSTRHDHQLSDFAGLAHTRIQFGCFASTRLVANALAEAIRSSGLIVLKGLNSDVDIRGVRCDDGQRNYVDYPTDGSDEHRYVTTIDFIFDYTET